MRIILLAASLVLTTLLTGCDRLTEVTISEDSINNYLAKHDNFNKKIGINGLADADFTLQKITIEIGRTEPNKVRLNGIALVKVDSLFGSRSIEMNLALRAQPYFDANIGAIYMKEMEIVDYTLDNNSLDTLFVALVPYLNTSLSAYFDMTPVYVLDAEKSNVEAAAKKFAKGLEIKPGRLIIPLLD